MASKTVKPEAAVETAFQSEQSLELLTIEALQRKHGVSKPIFAGVCAANGWRPGRAMTDRAFCQAVTEFARSPMRGPMESEAKK